MVALFANKDQKHLHPDLPPHGEGEKQSDIKENTA